MTVNETHAILLMNAAEEVAELANLLTKLHSEVIAAPTKRGGGIRSLSMQCAAVLRSCIHAKLAADTFLRNLQVGDEK